MPVFKVIYRPGPYVTDTGLPKYHDDEALEMVISYCQDTAKTGGQYIGGFGVNVAQAAYEMNLLAWTYGANKGLRLRHWILAFSSDKVKQFGSNVYPMLDHIARQAAAYYGSQYQIIYAIHMDRDHPHIHFVMNTVSFEDGKKYSDGLVGFQRVKDFLEKRFPKWKTQLIFREVYAPPHYKKT